MFFYDTSLSPLHRQLETELEQQTTELKTSQDALKQKEEESQKLQQELQASKDVLWDAEKRLENQELELKSSQKSLSDIEKQMELVNQEVHDSQSKVRQQEAELARLREVLRRTEQELDERVAHLEQRCLFSEEERRMFSPTIMSAEIAQNNLLMLFLYMFCFRQDSGGGSEESGGVEDRAELPKGGEKEADSASARACCSYRGTGKREGYTHNLILNDAFV